MITRFANERDASSAWNYHYFRFEDMENWRGLERTFDPLIRWIVDNIVDSLTSYYFPACPLVSRVWNDLGLWCIYSTSLFFFRVNLIAVLRLILDETFRRSIRVGSSIKWYKYVTLFFEIKDFFGFWRL